MARAAEPMKQKTALKSFIVSHSIDTTIVVQAKDIDAAAEKAEAQIRAYLNEIDEHAHFRLCDVSENG